MLKQKMWLTQIPIVIFFTLGMFCYDLGEKQELNAEWARENILPTLEKIQGFHTDLKFKLRGTEKPREKIVIVAIDDESITEHGRWPWHRDKTSNLIINTLENGAKIVGLDMVFSEPDVRLPPEVSERLKQVNETELARKFETDESLVALLDGFSENIVLGWVIENPCIPSGDASSVCPVGQSEFIANYPKDIERFAIKNVVVPAGTKLSNSVIPIALTPIPNFTAFNEKAQNVGLFNTDLDPDGVTRRTRLVWPVATGHFYPTLAFEMARKIRGGEYALEIDSQHRVRSLALNSTIGSIPVNARGEFSINFRGGAQAFNYISAKDLMPSADGTNSENRVPAGMTKEEFDEKRKKELQKQLKDAYVIIGVTALGAFDMRAFPFGANIAGVEGHANILDNLLTRDWLNTHHGPIAVLILYLLMTVGALAFAWGIERLESIPALGVAIAMLVAVVLIDQKLYFERGELWNTSILIIEYGAVFLTIFSLKYVMEERNKKFIKGAFAKYVSPAIIDSIMEDPTKLSLGGEKRELSILFSDIRSFTTFSEKMDAKVLATFLNEYLGHMTDIVFETGGTLDKYIGDAVMAFWGAPLTQPEHAKKSCDAALLMHKKLRELQPHFKSKYGIDVNIGIGINTGAVNVGNMGSDRVFEYTVIGDHVNLASRLEGLTKEYHSSILTTRFTIDSIENAKLEVPRYRVLDLVKVKGKKQAIELIQILEENFSDQRLEHFEAGRQHYLKREWEQAIEKFRTVVESGDEDEMSRTFIERCEYYRNNPPDADWDGAWVMTTK